MGEKFGANPVTGTGSMTIPIAVSPGRSGFGPHLSLSYDSGAGNGPFGLGWHLSQPSITRKTDRGLPKYLDAEESDEFILSDAEDLVPVGDPFTRGAFVIQRYRPRVEGLFARIECWSDSTNQSTNVFWRSISKDNITTWYGKDDNSRIFDPSDPSRMFSWLICESYDTKGNVIVYQYQSEDSKQIDLSLAHEANRNDVNRSANRYLKFIRYGNRSPYFPEITQNSVVPLPPEASALDGTGNLYFEVVFDYGEHDTDSPTPDGVVDWPCRNDPFSSYRAGFEIRTYRLCQRVLMFHHFPNEEGIGKNCLVRSTDFTYTYEQNRNAATDPIHSVLTSVTQYGYKRKANGYLKKAMPPVDFHYTQAKIHPDAHTINPESLENLPYGLDGSNYQWVDLDGEGSSGILTEQAGGWFYKRNLSPLNTTQGNDGYGVGPMFGPLERVKTRPSLATISGGRQQLIDLAGDGQLDLVDFEGATPGFYERTHEEGWESFRAFERLPNLDWGNPNLKFVDLTGDGHADILISEDEAFVWHRSLAETGFAPAQRVQQRLDEETGPRLIFADGTQAIYFADMSGDGLNDLVRIRNSDVSYWPNLGYGSFGAKVAMDGAPCFDHQEQFDQQR
ncbi:MAG: SpvB/TcaC N-terminal domain-containing protein, partial [Gammaproteobacteria bacterium]